MITAAALAALFVCVIMAGVSDFRTLKIPNGLSVAIVALFAAAYAAGPDDFGPFWMHLAGGAGMLVVTFLMFAVGMIGAGDSKLGAALGLWVGLKGMLAYIFFMSLAGGVLGLCGLAIRKFKPAWSAPEGSWIAQLQDGRNAVPYGIAIGIGAVAGLMYTGFVPARIENAISFFSGT